jgi:serine/threonine-protein kinase RsbW
MKSFADEVHFNSLGRRGKQVVIAKKLPLWDTIKEASIPPTATVTTTQAAPVELRQMRPDEGVGLARLIYRCYGYTYVHDSIYSPETTRDYLKSGLVISYVAVTPDGEIVGHTALVREKPEDRVGEMGQAVVDPRYRARKLLEQLSVLVVEKARAQGLAGAFAESVTAHPYSQKSALALGFRETGALLGFIPAALIIRKIQDRESPRRSSAILQYYVFNQGSESTLYLPARHETLIRRIYQNINIRRTLVSGTQVEPAVLPPDSQISIKVSKTSSYALLKVVAYGADLEHTARHRLREFCNRRIDCIHIDLPLDNPAAPASCTAMEKLGFFFGGIIPETPEGDVLRLQYLNNVETDPADCQTASDFSRELLEYVNRARKEAEDMPQV